MVLKKVWQKGEDRSIRKARNFKDPKRVCKNPKIPTSNPLGEVLGEGLLLN